MNKNVMLIASNLLAKQLQFLNPMQLQSIAKLSYCCSNDKAALLTKHKL